MDLCNGSLGKPGWHRIGNRFRIHDDIPVSQCFLLLLHNLLFVSIHVIRTSMGLPINPSWQEQTARLFSTRHLELAPHGVGVQ